MTKIEQRMLHLLQWHFWDKGHYPIREKIAEELGISRQRVDIILKQLVARGDLAGYISDTGKIEFDYRKVSGQTLHKDRSKSKSQPKQPSRASDPLQELLQPKKSR